MSSHQEDDWIKKEALARKFFKDNPGANSYSAGVYTFQRTDFSREELSTEAVEEQSAAKATEGLRYDAEKLDISLISPWAIAHLAHALNYGRHKYAEHNWRKGMKWSRVLASMMRHLFLFLCGQEIDKESGFHHLSAVLFGAMVLLEYQWTHSELDDRYKFSAEHQEKLADYFAGMLDGTVAPKNSAK